MPAPLRAVDTILGPSIPAANNLTRYYRLVAGAGATPHRLGDRTTFAMGAGSPTGHRRQSAFASP